MNKHFPEIYATQFHDFFLLLMFMPNTLRKTCQMTPSFLGKLKIATLGLLIQSFFIFTSQMAQISLKMVIYDSFLCFEALKRRCLWILAPILKAPFHEFFPRNGVSVHFMRSMHWIYVMPLHPMGMYWIYGV